MSLGLNTQIILRSNVEGNKVSVTDCVNLFGVAIDNELKFYKYVKTLSFKVNKKINAFLDKTHIFPENRHY